MTKKVHNRLCIASCFGCVFNIKRGLKASVFLVLEPNMSKVVYKFGQYTTSCVLYTTPVCITQPTVFYTQPLCIIHNNFTQRQGVPAAPLFRPVNAPSAPLPESPRSPDADLDSNPESDADLDADWEHVCAPDYTTLCIIHRHVYCVLDATNCV